jgi:hypothetical protein
MKKTVFISIFVLLGFTFSSCEEKMELNSENSEQKIFVEAMFADNSMASYLHITKTKGIYESVIDHPKVEDAIVKLVDETDGSVINYTHEGGGSYTTNVSGIVGHTYRLEIDAEGQHITAQQSMLAASPLNRIVSKPTDTAGVFSLETYFEDDPATEDYYLYIMYPADQTVDPRFSVTSDLQYNRDNHSLVIPDEVFNNGEQWFVFMFHIDRANYNYLKVILRALKSLNGGSHPFYGISLGNPKSTVQGEKVMGYFIASPVSFSPIIIGN